MAVCCFHDEVTRSSSPGQRYALIPRDESANPMNWVRQKTTSSYTAVIMNPRQAFEILLNIPEPRRTLVLTDAATALRVSEILGLTWMDLDFEDHQEQLQELALRLPDAIPDRTVRPVE